MAGGGKGAGKEALQARIAALESELDQAKAELSAQRGKETWFKGLVEIAPDAMLVHGVDRKIVYVNPAGVRLFGAMSSDQVIGTLATSLTHPEARQSTDNEIDGILSGAVSSLSLLEQRRLRLDGTDFHADVTASAIIWEDKPAALVVVRDISDRIRARKKYEAAEGRRREAYTRLSDAIEAMSEGFALFDADDRLQIYNQQYVDRFSGIARDIIQPGVTFDEIVAELTQHRNLIDDGGDLAKKAIDRHRNLPSEAEINYASGLWIRQSKKRTRDGGVVSVYADITDLKAREQALQDSEARHRQMLKALPDAVVISVDTKIVFANAAAVDMFGAKDAGDLIGRDAHSLAPSALRDAQRERRRKVLAEQCTLPPTEQQRIRLDGTVFDVETVATFMMWEGKPAFIGVLRDITARKEAEALLAESESRYRDLLEALPDAMTIHQDGKLVFVNAAAVRLFGADNAGELVGQDSNRQVPPELISLQQTHRDKVLKERCTLPPVEQQRVRLNGSVVDVETVSSFIMWQGRPAVIGVLRDISERKDAEKVLAATERRLGAVTDHIPGAVYERVQSPDGKISFSYVSAGVHEVTGLTSEEITQDASLFINSIREDFREEYREHFRHSADQMMPSNIEFPLTGPDGSLRWLHTTGRPLRRADGSVVWDGIMIDVTETKIAQEIAERNHQWLLQAISSMPVGFMLWDPDDKLVLWNQRVANFHPDPTVFREGLSFEDLLKTPYEDVRGRLGQEAANEWLTERREQHKTARGNYEFQGIGSIWFTLRERRTPDGFTVTMLSDVSDRHESQTRLLESEKRYRTMINLSPDAIYVHKLGIIVVCNEAALDLFGASSADQLIGRELLDFTHPDHREKARERRSTVYEQGTRIVAMRQKRLRLDGSWFWAEVAAAAIDWEGERGGVVVLRDISAQIAAEEELIRSKEEAELANRAKTEFLANISHELRTPLNAIIGFSDLMQREMLGPLGNEQYASYIHDIHQSGSHLHDVINDILDLSKIEAGQMELQETTVNVKRAIERCIRVVATRAEDNGLKLVTDLPGSLPLITADERKLKQILINLISNAVKFTEAGGTITVGAVAGANGGVTIRVIDSGIGIAPEDLPKVFRPFEQVDNSLSRTHEGTGLGLPLTKSLVELHDGTLELESELGAGTTATVKLPAARAGEQLLAAQ
jgi:PAS domain S-box-containing protein